MSASLPQRHQLPHHYALKGRTFVLHQLREGDSAPMISFAQKLPPDDLLFLQQDITQPAEITNWIQEATTGNIITIVAWEGDTIVGYAAFDRGRAKWMRHVAEIRVAVTKSVRRIGVGRLLLELAFEIAIEAGVSKVVAQMTPDQIRAIELFKRLGFEPEATLRDHALDSHGCTHDLLVYSYFTQQHLEHRCDACGAPVMAGFSMNGANLCLVCYHTEYQELGGGD